MRKPTKETMYSACRIFFDLYLPITTWKIEYVHIVDFRRYPRLPLLPHRRYELPGLGGKVVITSLIETIGLNVAAKLKILPSPNTDASLRAVNLGVPDAGRYQVAR